MSATTNQTMPVVTDSGVSQPTQPTIAEWQTDPTPVTPSPSSASPSSAAQPAEYREPRYFGTQREPERRRVIEFIANTVSQIESRVRPAVRKKASATVRRKKDWDSDPVEWRGRKVRKLSNRQTYTIKQVFRNGRVELERDWMTYLTDVETIREEYESER